AVEATAHTNDQRAKPRGKGRWTGSRAEPQRGRGQRQRSDVQVSCAIEYSSG
ncbi:hypothetical protein FRC07_010175, partial [Ceratobasidium sp. 392]